MRERVDKAKSEFGLVILRLGAVRYLGCGCGRRFFIIEDNTEIGRLPAMCGKCGGVYNAEIERLKLLQLGLKFSDCDNLKLI